MKSKLFCLHVWGDYACFTRPELKVERYSYDFITPAAARAIFEAIYVEIHKRKAVMEWKVREIWLLRHPALRENAPPVNWTSVRRNEINFAEGKREQRNSRILKNVDYLLFADFEINPDVLEGMTEMGHVNPLGKFAGCFERRARAGKVFGQPYLGCREFSCNVEFVEDPEIYRNRILKDVSVPDSGLMFYDWNFKKPKPEPSFFRPRIENGIIRTCPDKVELVL